ncbi:pyrimidine reductase family protein [Egibacter rhizosphaerae]|uniref:Pyrimidine reductase family protein n=1 Tax=Egibacter rhizosphaerae TaxID=1670831 RepID=A0A411YDG3_9ACTN|nr:pyrimidine reductase family protein [Egibacter rhizosphaerae]QBI19269.1 pyrimidine reductase family protein [Egibacter rhizosphaerae]
MRRLLPEPVTEIEPYDAYRPAHPHAALLRVNMVTSLDGHATDAEGVSGLLGGDGDFRVLVALRALADAILVGAGTARAEDYGPHRLRPTLAERRRADGRDHPAPVVVLTASCELDPGARLFTAARTSPIVVTCRDAPRQRRRALERVAEVVEAGEEAVDLPTALQALRARGYAHVLCEGGPTLNAQLFAARLVDELCLTLAPQLAGGTGPSIVDGLQQRASLRLEGLLAEDEELFARYAVAR